MILAATLTLALSAAAAEPATAAERHAAADRLILVLIETQKGRDQAILRRYGIGRLEPATNLPELQRELSEALGRQDIYAPLLRPTVCPGARVTDSCDGVRGILDVDLPAVIEGAQGSRIFLLRPWTAYFKDDRPDRRAYAAYFVVDVLGPGGHRHNTFRIGYVDGHCDSACVQTSYAASARELAAMFDYMVEVDIGHRTSAVPKTWRDKQRVRDFSGWANPCQRNVANDRLIRKYGERLWTSGTPEPNIALESVAWRGCNIFEAPAP